MPSRGFCHGPEPNCGGAEGGRPFEPLAGARELPVLAKSIALFFYRHFAVHEFLPGHTFRMESPTLAGGRLAVRHPAHSLCQGDFLFGLKPFEGRIRRAYCARGVQVF